MRSATLGEILPFMWRIVLFQVINGSSVVHGSCMVVVW